MVSGDGSSDGHAAVAFGAIPSLPEASIMSKYGTLPTAAEDEEAGHLSSVSSAEAMIENHTGCLRLRGAGEEGKGCNPFKFIIALPFMLLGAVLSAFFFVVWIVLMPIKCCCPGGCIIGLLEWVFSTLVMLPVNIANWALK